MPRVGQTNSYPHVDLRSVPHPYWTGFPSTKDNSCLNVTKVPQNTLEKEEKEAGDNPAEACVKVEKMVFICASMTPDRQNTTQSSLPSIFSRITSRRLFMNFISKDPSSLIFRGSRFLSPFFISIKGILRRV
jgi:hypothetical protein